RPLTHRPPLTKARTKARARVSPKVNPKPKSQKPPLPPPRLRRRRQRSRPPPRLRLRRQRSRPPPRLRLRPQRSRPPPQPKPPRPRARAKGRLSRKGKPKETRPPGTKRQPKKTSPRTRKASPRTRRSQRVNESVFTQGKWPARSLRRRLKSRTARRPFHIRAKLSNSVSPAAWLFSGWNCTPMTLSRPQIEANRRPYSVSPITHDGSAGSM